MTPLKWWRLETVYSFARITLENKAGGNGRGHGQPQRQPTPPGVLNSRTDLPGGFEIDPTGKRHVTSPSLHAPDLSIPSYWTVDLQLAGTRAKRAGLSPSAANLAQNANLRESNENVNEIQRGVYGKPRRWRSRESASTHLLSKGSARGGGVLLAGAEAPHPEYEISFPPL